MKYVCDGCERLVELSSYRIEEEALVARCDRCGAQTRAKATQGGALSRVVHQAQAPAAQPPSPSPSSPFTSQLPPHSNVVPLRTPGPAPGSGARATGSAVVEVARVPEGHCPKCIAPKAEGALTCASCGLTYDNFRPEEFELSAPVAALWQAVLAGWEEPARHDAFLSAAYREGELPSAGRLYRILLALRPEDPLAQRGRDEVLRRALLVEGNLSDAGKVGQRVQRFKTGTQVVLIILTVACLFYVLTQLL